MLKSLEQLEPDVLFLRALIAFLHGGDRSVSKGFVRSCLIQSSAQHGGAWLLIACLLSQLGNLEEALEALETGAQQQNAKSWLSCLLCARAHVQLARMDSTGAQNSLVAAVAHAVDKSQAAVV